jgi:hypothetical protein
MGAKEKDLFKRESKNVSTVRILETGTVHTVKLAMEEDLFPVSSMKLFLKLS